MPRKFVYAPGLPGYGTRGVDGSTGLLGLATYFSAYDGNSDSVTIKSKIIANKELFSNDQVIPGYPERIYQTGDVFIDKNARVFQIDFNESNLYKDTGIFLNTSGFFSEGPPQTLAPEFQRYSNSFETDKFLIDSVYTNSVGDYTQYPTLIYSNNPRYYGKVDYIGEDIVVDLNGHYPFQVWSIGGLDPANNAIALVREEDNNTWHFGNSNGGALRDVSLYLDFKDIYGDTFHGDFDGNFSGTISATNLYLPGWLRVDGDTSIGGSIYIDNIYKHSSGASYINLHNNVLAKNLRTLGDVSIGNDLYIQGSNIDFKGTGDKTINFVINKGILKTDNSIYIETNTAASGLNAGNIYLIPGNGGIGTIGGNGGSLSIGSGKGGDAIAASGHGGKISIICGRGGHTGTTDPSHGGIMWIFSGNGGNYTGTSTNNGGDGGQLLILGGGGGSSSSTSSFGGDGAPIKISAGAGGQNSVNASNMEMQDL